MSTGLVHRSPGRGKPTLIALVLVSTSLFLLFHDYTPQHDVIPTQTGAAAAEHGEIPHVDVLCALLLVGSGMVLLKSRPSHLVRDRGPAAPRARLRPIQLRTWANASPALLDFCPMLA